MAPLHSAALAPLPGRLEVSVRNTFLHAVVLDAATPKEDPQEQPCMKRANTVHVSWPRSEESREEVNESEEEVSEDVAKDLDELGSPAGGHTPFVPRMATFEPWDSPLEQGFAQSSGCEDGRCSTLGDLMNEQALLALGGATGGAGDISRACNDTQLGDVRCSVGQVPAAQAAMPDAFAGPAMWDWAPCSTMASAFAMPFGDHLGGLPSMSDQRQAFKLDGQYQAFNAEFQCQAFSHEGQHQAYSSENSYQYETTSATLAQLRPVITVGGADTDTSVMCREASSIEDVCGPAVPDATAARTIASRRQAASGAPGAGPEQTTVMLRNLPNNYSRAMLLELIDAEGFAGSYDFLYLPIDFRTHAALGYAFINLVSQGEAERLKQCFNGFMRWSLPSSKVCSAAWSHPYQGLDAHLARYRNSPLMHESVPDEYRPILFKEGARIAFPPPTKKVKPPRQGTERMLV